MDYTHFLAEDFAADESFQQFALEMKGEAADFWNSWVSRHPEKKEEVELARKIVLSLQFRHQDVEEKKRFDLHQLQLKLFKDDLVTIGAESTNAANRRFVALKYAASLILLVAAVFAALYVTDMRLSLQTAGADRARVEKTTPRGQKQTLQLLDGTVVRLNSESKLLYEEDPDKNTREVYLKGEAFFQVARDAERPFIVHSGPVKTMVLGTEFNVRSYPEEEKITVALVRGKVEISNADNAPGTSIFLKPNEMVSIESGVDGSYQVTAFNPREITGWKDGILYFDEADFDEIVRKLEQWYDVKIEVKGNFTGRAFTGEFENESLQAVLHGIGFSLHFRYTMNGREVTIVSNV